MSEARDNAIRKFYEAGLMPFLGSLQASSVDSKREALMAFRPALWGLHAWVSGDTVTLMDEKGFLCSLPISNPLFIQLITFESTQGPGTLRLVLTRQVVDPQAAIQKVRPVYNPHKEVPFTKTQKEEKPLRRRRLSPSDFSKLLGEI